MPESIGIGRHGESRSYNSGGHHDSQSSGWLSFLRSGKLADLERNHAISRWSIAHNPGWAYRDNVITFGNGAERYRAVDRALDEMVHKGPENSGAGGSPQRKVFGIVGVPDAVLGPLAGDADAKHFKSPPHLFGVAAHQARKNEAAFLPEPR